MSKLTIISVLFNYPVHYQPIYFNKLRDNYPELNFDVIRYWDADYGIADESYYFKFTYYRIFKFLEYLKTKVLGEYEYFLLTDATDVAYVDNFEYWRNLLNYYECSILFGAEKFLWPPTDYSYLYKNKNIPTEFKYLNAGVVLAETQAYIDHLENIISRNLVGLCDQGNWQIEYLLTSDIGIDYESKLVLNTFNAKDDFNIKEDTIEFKNSSPIFVHDNGGYNEETVKLVPYFL